MTKQQETDINLFLVIAIVLTAILLPTFLKIKNWFLQTFNKISTIFNSVLKYVEHTTFFQILLYILFTIFIIYVLYQIIKLIIHKISEKRENIKNELKEIKKLLKIKATNREKISESINLINEKIRICENSKRFVKYIEPLEKKLINLELSEEELKQKEHLGNLQLREKEIDARNEEKERKLRESEENKQILLRRLRIEENRVFKKSDLNDKEVEILKEEGFEQVNQFDILEKRFISVLIKPYEKLNHSREHIFLVWSVTRFLEYNGIKIIEEHLTKGADITFKYKGKWFAIEIETGKLLRAPKQLKEKVNYLNKQYPNRWLFIVSNEKLVPRYAKFGLSTQRNRVPEMFEKLLKNA